MKISLRYPLTEAVGAALFATIGVHTWTGRYSVGETVLGFAATVVYLAVAVIDVETRRIPRQLVYWGMAVCIPVGAVAVVLDGRPGAVLVGIAGALGLSGCLLLVHEMNPKWMGFGDVRYGLFLGWTLGIFSGRTVLVAVGVALLLGSVVGLGLIAVGRAQFGQALPFGPFLSAGAFVAMLWGDQVASWYLRILGLSTL